MRGGGVERFILCVCRVGPFKNKKRNCTKKKGEKIQNKILKSSGKEKSEGQ